MKKTVIGVVMTLLGAVTMWFAAGPAQATIVGPVVGAWTTNPPPGLSNGCGSAQVFLLVDDVIGQLAIGGYSGPATFLGTGDYCGSAFGTSGHADGTISGGCCGAESVTGSCTVTWAPDPSLQFGTLWTLTCTDTVTTLFSTTTSTECAKWDTVFTTSPGPIVGAVPPSQC